MKSTTRKTLGTITWIIFLASFAPYLLLISTAIFGGNTGLMGVSNWEYGGSAVYFTVVIFCFIPIYPITLIYQFLYGIIALRRANSRHKKITLIIIASILALIIFPVCIHDTYKVYLNKKFYKENYPKVDAYMKNQYSPEVYESAKLVRYSRKDGFIIMNVNCDLGGSYTDTHNDTMDVYYFIEADGSVRDNFNTLFGTTFNQEFYDGLCNYLASNVNLPSNWFVNVGNLYVDLSHYKPGDTAESVYPYCKYESCNITFYMSEYSEEEFINNINKYRSEYEKYFKGTNNFYVVINGDYFAGAHYYPNEDGYVADIFGYTNGSGIRTIDDTTVKIHD